MSAMKNLYGDLDARANWQTALLRASGLMLALALSLVIVLAHEHLRVLGRYGYAGVFLVSLASSATVLLPAPSLALVFASGTMLNPLALGLVAATGETLGELVGYLAGASGSAIVKDHARYQQLARLTHHYGLALILVLAVIPNPVFDLVGIAAGALRLPVGRFFLACWVGKLVKATMVALLGARSLAWLAGFG
jgi:membrane protein YqaA with SNARE-associated domain